MKNRLIAIDIDDVLSSQTDVLISFSNENYGTQLTRDDFLTPGEYWGYYKNIWDIDSVEATNRFKIFLDEDYPLKQIIDPGVLTFLGQLKSEYDLEIVTARSKGYQKVTTLWLEEHAPGLFNDVHFVEIWDEKLGEKATKAKICTEIGAGYLIDDNVEHCNLASEVGVKSLLFGNYGWNIDKQVHSLVTRVSDWKGVAEYFRNERNR